MYYKKQKKLSHIYIKSDYLVILEDKYESYVGEDVVDSFIGRMSYYNKLSKEIFSINIPLKADIITPFYSSCYYCNEDMGEEILRDHDRLNGEFRGYADNNLTFNLRITLYQHMHLILLIVITTYL